MLKVSGLTKIYSKGDVEVKALNNVTFTLGDTGFVFVTGKSCCGKSQKNYLSLLVMRILERCLFSKFTYQHLLSMQSL